MRRAPSSLTTSPLIIGFSASACTRWANSPGCPKRDGKGTCCPKKFRTRSGKPASNGVENNPKRDKKKGVSRLPYTLFHPKNKGGEAFAL